MTTIQQGLVTLRATELHEKARMPWEDAVELAMSEQGISLPLYLAVNKLVCQIGYEGSIDSAHAMVAEVMNALHDIDGGSTLTRTANQTAKAAPVEGVKRRWPFVETPGEFTERLRTAIQIFGDLLSAVRNVLIENPAQIAAPPTVVNGAVNEAIPVVVGPGVLCSVCGLGRHVACHRPLLSGPNAGEPLDHVFTIDTPPGRGMVPMTEEQIEGLADTAFKEHFEDKNDNFHVALARAVEAHHGIVAPGSGALGDGGSGT